MKIILMIILGILSFSCLCCLCHCVYRLIKEPQKFYYQFLRPENGISHDPLSKAKKLYLFFVLAAVFVMAFTGTKELLFFIPNSWGRVVEGEFITIKHTIATVVAVCSIALIDLGRKHLIMFNELNNKS